MQYEKKLKKSEYRKKINKSENDSADGGGAYLGMIKWTWMSPLHPLFLTLETFMDPGH